MAQKCRKTRQSSGLGRSQRANQELKKLEMKIARWERNQKNPLKVSSWKKEQNVRKSSRHDNWNTERMEARCDFLRMVLKKGSTTGSKQ